MLAPDHPWLLSTLAGACAATGANIVDAQIFTTTDGRALDTIAVSREFEQDDDEVRRGARIADTIEKALGGTLKLPEVVARALDQQGRLKAFTIEPEVTINNQWSNRYTVIEVIGPRPAGPALRADRDAVEAQPQHHLGARGDVRRARGRRVLCHRSAGREDRLADPRDGDQAFAAAAVRAGGLGPDFKARRLQPQKPAARAKHAESNKNGTGVPVPKHGRRFHFVGQASSARRADEMNGKSKAD